MGKIKTIVKTILDTNGLYLRILIVIVAFALMVVLCSLFVSDILRGHLMDNAKEAANDVKHKLEIDIIVAEMTLRDISDKVREIINQGGDENTVADYLQYLTENDISMGRLKYNNVFGYFNVFGGEGVSGKYISGETENLPADYDATKLPWYEGAKTANGAISVIPIYKSADNDEYVMTYSYCVFDGEGNVMFTIGMNITFDNIIKYVSEMALTENSYGFLESENSIIMAHPNTEFIGKNVNDVNAELFGYRTNTKLGSAKAERALYNYNEKDVVEFESRLSNGWVLTVIIPRSEYYQEYSQITVVISIFGLNLAALLSLILIRMDKATKKADAIASQQSELLGMIWESVESGIVLIDAETFKLIDVNQYAVRMYGGTKEDMIGNTCNKFFGTHECPLHGTGNASCASCRKERSFTKADGTVIPIINSAKRMQRNGRTVILESFEDISYIKEIESKNRLLEQGRNMQIMLDTMPIGCTLWNKNDEIISCNEECVRLFETKDKQDYMDRFFELSPHYQPNGRLSKEMAIEMLDKAFEEGELRFEWTHNKANGETIPAEITLIRVAYQDGFAIAAYLRDLTENRMLNKVYQSAHELRVSRDAAENANQAKSQFLATMSHEIRTPMNAILGITEMLLRDESIKPEMQEALDNIYYSGDLLLSIINDILDLSKIEAGKLELFTLKYEMASLINDTVALNTIRIGSKPIKFVLSVDENIPSTLIGDDLRIKQILNNLLSNAIKYTSKGTVKLSVSVKDGDNNYAVIVFSVSDTGNGMTAAQVANLFDEYARFNMEANRTTEGTGLGMSITQKLIDMMSGSISVESEPNRGSVFTVEIPQERADSKVIGKELAERLELFKLDYSKQHIAEQIVIEPMPYGKVLIVDDTESNLYVARGLLAPYGLSIITVTSGFEAIEKIKSGEIYDIVFMDHMMPVMDGIEATRIIRGLGYSNPIVALTANAVVGQAEVFLANGFDDFISKPIDMRHIAAVLKKYIRNKQPTQDIEVTPALDEELNNGKEKEAQMPAKMPPVDPQLIELFEKDVAKAISILEYVCGKQGEYADDDLRKYTTAVHSMKSALGNIGETELSATAAKLEKAGRDSDTEVILLETPPFLIELRLKIDLLSRSIEKAKNKELENEDYLFLRDKLLAFKEANNIFGRKTQKAILAELREDAWPQPIIDSLNTLNKLSIEGEIEEIGALVDKNIIMIQDRWLSRD